MPEVETHLPSTDEASLAARAFLRNALRTWELDGFGAVTELLTSELVSNVVRHVGSPVTLRAVHGGGVLRVEVADSSPELPVLRHPDPLAESGRGMLLVDKLANEWGAEARGDGKIVWFVIDVSTATEEVHGDSTSSEHHS